jgi:hypothetical protein
MLVLSGVFNTIILDTTNYANQDCMLVKVTGSQSKKRLMFLPGYGPIAIADWSIIVQCHLLVKHGLVASIGAVVDMGILNTLKRLLMESTMTHATRALSTACITSPGGLALYL